MATTMKRGVFFQTADGQNIVAALQRMMDDGAYNTAPSYSANTIAYPDNLIPFKDKHINYLTAHPKVDAQTYVANLQLMTRRRG